MIKVVLLFNYELSKMRWCLPHHFGGNGCTTQTVLRVRRGADESVL